MYCCDEMPEWHKSINFCSVLFCSVKEWLFFHKVASLDHPQTGGHSGGSRLNAPGAIFRHSN